MNEKMVSYDKKQAVKKNICFYYIIQRVRIATMHRLKHTTRNNLCILRVFKK